MESRRYDDRVPAMLVARAATPGTEAGAALGTWLSELEHGKLTPLRAAFRGSIAPLLVVDAGVGDLLLVTGADVRQLPRGKVGSIADVAAYEAKAWQRRCAVAASKQHFCEGFVIFVERLNRARSASEVYDALLQHTPEMVGGYAAVLMLATIAADATTQLYPLPDAQLPVLPEALPVETVRRRPVPGLITRVETLPGMPYEQLAPLFTHAGARQLACVAIGSQTLLLLMERRRDREFGGEDWFRLQTIARHAECVIERLQLIDELHAAKVTANYVDA